MASRSLADLHPLLQPLAMEFLKLAELQGIHVIITCTFRSPEEQAREYARGRTVSSGIDVVPVIRPLGRVVTRAKPGQSAHNFMLNNKPASKAFDVVPVVNGKATWNDKDPAWQKLGKIGMDLGLNWYGAPGSPFKEFPHLQLRG